MSLLVNLFCFVFPLVKFLVIKWLDHKVGCMFNFLRNCKTIFHSACTIFYFTYSEWESSPTFDILVSLIFTTLVGAE